MAAKQNVIYTKKYGDFHTPTVGEQLFRTTEKNIFRHDPP
jgi:hypothetical protein